MRKAAPLSIMALLPSLSGGGAERVVINLVNALCLRKICPVLVVLNDNGAYREALCASLELEVLGRSRLIFSLLEIIGAINRRKPVVLLSSFGYINVALLTVRFLFPASSRLWLREANLPSISLPNNRFPRLMRWAYVVLYRRADLLICSSERMQDEFVSQFRVPASKIRVLPNPVDENAIRLRATEFPKVRASGRCFVAAGRLTYQKGFDRLLVMFAELDDNESELVILGEGVEENSLRQQAEELGINARVLFVGFTDYPWSWFAVADAFLLPSRWEGMPNAALEALACGVPVIATPESGGIAEVAAVAEPGAVQVVETGKPFIDAMRKVTHRPKDKLPPSFLPPQYRLESVVDTFVSWLNQID